MIAGGRFLIRYGDNFFKFEVYIFKFNKLDRYLGSYVGHMVLLCVSTKLLLVDAFFAVCRRSAKRLYRNVSSSLV